MKRTLFLLALVVGIALAEEETEEEGRDAGLAGLKVVKTAALASMVGPLGALFEIGLQVVILVALILLISTLAKHLEKGGYLGKHEGEEDYGYYASGGYDTGATGSSYASTGSHHHSSDSNYYAKRSVDAPSIMDLPVVQRLTQQVHEAIDSFNL